MSPLSRWRALTAELGGTPMALLYLLHRLMQTLSGGRGAIVPYLLVAQPIGNPALAGVRPDAATVVTAVQRGDALLAAFPRPAPINEQRFDDGATCHAALVKGEFAGHIWIARGRYLEDEVRCTYVLADPARSVWDFDVYIEPRHRLGRTMARLWKAVDDLLVEQGVAWTFSRINRFNAGSVRSHHRLGARAVGWVTFVVLGRLQLRFGGGAGVTISPDATRGPEVRLTPPDRTGDA